MKKNNILKNLLNNIQNQTSEGLKIAINEQECIIKGKTCDLIELADYILDVALSKEKKDHIHLDNTILLSKTSEIKEIIIEKEE